MHSNKLEQLITFLNFHFKSGPLENRYFGHLFIKLYIKTKVTQRYDTLTALIAISSFFQMAISDIIKTPNLFVLLYQFVRFSIFKIVFIYNLPCSKKRFKVGFSIKFIEKHILQTLQSQEKKKKLKAFYHNLLILSSCLRACCLSKMFSSCKRKNLSSSSSRLIRDTAWRDFIVRVVEVSAKMPR